MDLTQVNHYLDLSSSSSSSVTLIIELQRVMKTKFHYTISISSNSLNKQIWKSVNRSRWTIDMVKIYNPKLEHSSPTIESTLIHLETIISLRHAVAICVIQKPHKNKTHSPLSILLYQKLQCRRPAAVHDTTYSNHCSPYHISKLRRCSPPPTHLEASAAVNHHQSRSFCHRSPPSTLLRSSAVHHQ